MNIRQTVGCGSGPDCQDIGEPSFADAIAAIGTSDALDVVTKRHWATSLRMLAQYLDLPTESIPARMLAVQHRVSKLHPAQLRVNPKTFANHRANAKAALNWFGQVAHGSARKAPMAADSRASLAKIANRHQRDVLSPFFRYLSGFGAPLSGVTDSHVADYARFRNDTGFSPFKATAQRQLVRAWNAAVTSVPDWPKVVFAEAPRAATHAGPRWDDFPETLREDIDSYCAKLAKPHRDANGRMRRVCRPSTIAEMGRGAVGAGRRRACGGPRFADLAPRGALVR